jgi:hypothetical protein
MWQSTRLASVVLAEPQSFQYDSITAVGVSGAAVDGGGAAAGIVPCVDNPTEVRIE